MARDAHGSVDGYARSEGESDYDYWQWVTAEDQVELDGAKEAGASLDILAEIQERLDEHLATFQIAVRLRAG